MIRCALPVILALSANGMAAAEHDGPDSWGRFSRELALGGERSEVSIGSLDETPHKLRLDYWMRLTRRVPGAPTRVSWADSRACPALRSVIESLRQLPPPHLDPPASAVYIPVQIDGGIYTLTVPTTYHTSASYTSNSGTPLAAWIDGALTKLQPCWRSARPAGAR